MVGRVGTSFWALRIGSADQAATPATECRDLPQHHSEEFTKRRASRQVFRSARHFPASFGGNLLKLAWLRRTRIKVGPISLVPQEVGMIKRVQRSVEKHFGHSPVSHLLKTPIRRKDVPANNSESPWSHL